jgi:hypothetical protein
MQNYTKKKKNKIKKKSILRNHIKKNPNISVDILHFSVIPLIWKKFEK